MGIYAFYEWCNAYWRQHRPGYECDLEAEFWYTETRGPYNMSEWL